MTGNDIHKNCLALMGYTSESGDILIDNNLSERFLELLSRAAADLRLDKISDLSDEISADQKVLDALCWGAAMLLALSEGDGAKNQLFASVYNSKRAAALSETESISDVLPSVGAEGI